MTATDYALNEDIVGIMESTNRKGQTKDYILHTVICSSDQQGLEK